VRHRPRSQWAAPRHCVQSGREGPNNCPFAATDPKCSIKLMVRRSHPTYSMLKPPRTLPATFEAERFLIRARQYRDQAMKLVDMEGYEPNWPKHFLMTHAIELAIHAYSSLMLPRGAAEKPGEHDLMELYEEAIRRGLKPNDLVLKELPPLSELHQIHYARYPKIEVKPVPAFISGYDDMVDQLLADVGEAFGETLRPPRRVQTN
jgi:hypothetical protein